MKKTILFFEVIILMIISFVLANGQEENALRFTENYWIFDVDDPYNNFSETTFGVELFDSVNQFKEIAISPSGRYVIGKTRIDSISAENPVFASSLYVWEVTQTERLFPRPIVAMPLERWQAQGRFVISPDENYLAIYAANEIQVWSLPELTLIQRFLAGDLFLETSQAIVWSADSQSIGVITPDNEQVIVLDIGSLVTYRHATDIVYDSANHVDIRLFEQNNLWVYYQPFTQCNADLTHCEEITLNAEGALSNWIFNREMNFGLVYSTNSNELTSVELFTLSLDSEGYALETVTEPRIQTFCPKSLSETGQYVYSWCRREGIGVIWNTQTWEIVQQIGDVPNAFRPFWLVADSYYLVLNSNFQLQLYSVESANPIDVLDVSSLDGVDSSLLAQSDLTGIVSMSDDGELVLVNLGGFMGVFEIE